MPRKVNSKFVKSLSQLKLISKKHLKNNRKSSSLNTQIVFLAHFDFYIFIIFVICIIILFSYVILISFIFFRIQVAYTTISFFFTLTTPHCMTPTVRNRDSVEIVQSSLQKMFHKLEKITQKGQKISTDILHSKGKYHVKENISRDVL